MNKFLFPVILHYTSSIKDDSRTDVELTWLRYTIYCRIFFLYLFRSVSNNSFDFHEKLLLNLWVLDQIRHDPLQSCEGSVCADVKTAISTGIQSG